MSHEVAGWPFSSWLDLDQLKREQDPALRDIGILSEDSLELMDFLLSGRIAPVPTGFSNIQVGFTATPWMGGRCRRTIPPTSYAISIDHGSWIQLLMAFLRLLTQPHVLPDQAESALLPLDRELGLLRFKAYPEYGLTDLFPGDAISPEIRDSKRAGCIRLLQFYAIQFMLLHELSHISRGHIQFRATRATSYSSLEARQRRRTIEREAQYLEFTADYYAIIYGIIVSIWSLGGKLVGADVITRRSIIMDHLRLWGFAVGVVFLLTEAYDNVVMGYSLHPHAAERRSFLKIAPALSRHIHPRLNLPGVEFDAARDSIDQGVGEAESAWDSLGWKRRTRQDIDVDHLIDGLKFGMDIEIPPDMKFPNLKTLNWTALKGQPKGNWRGG